MIVIMLVSTGIGMFASDSAQAVFIDDSLAPLPSDFTVHDTAWNDAGTMAVVVGYNSAGGSCAYTYWPHNDTYTPIAGGGAGQTLRAVDYFREPIYDIPNVLLVNADWYEDGLIYFYQNVLAGCRAYVDTWEVWGTANRGKPIAADMAPYDLVIWIPSRDMRAFSMDGEAFNSQDQNEVTNYMYSGGNFFLSNSYFSNNFGGSTFHYWYLGVNSYNSASNYEYGISPVTGDNVYGDLGWGSQNWGGYGWFSRQGQTDVLFANGEVATSCFWGWDDVGNEDVVGLRTDYYGIFKTVFLGFPLETLSVQYATQIMQRSLDWFSSSSQDVQPDTIDQYNEYAGNSYYVDVGMDITSPWAQSFVPQHDWIACVEFFMYKDYASTDFFEIQIFPDDGSNQPDYMGMSMTSGYINPEAIPIGSSNAAWVQCFFEGGGTSLVPGNRYWIVCIRHTYDNSQYWLVDDSASYSDGSVKALNGNWQLYSYDFLFRTHFQATLAIDQSNEYTGNSEYIYVLNNVAWAQSFVPTANTISAVEFYMYSDGSVGGFYVEVWEDSGGQPTGMQVVSSEIIYSQIPVGMSNADWVRCTFTTPASLTPYQTYWVTCSPYGAAPYNQFWIADRSFNYADGEALVFNGELWDTTYYDWIFRTYSLEINSGSGGGAGNETVYSVQLYPAKDNTIYSEDIAPDNHYSNGYGYYLSVGTTWNPYSRRALIEFDLAGSIAKYSTIQSAKLNLYCGWVIDDQPRQIQIRAMEREWGESWSNAGWGVEYGDWASSDDATWHHAFYDYEFWAPGGEYGTTALATQSVHEAYRYYTFSSQALASNVQAWLDAPNLNHGLMLMGEEGYSDTIKAFNSRHISNSPILEISYTLPQIIGYRDAFWMCGDSMGPATVYRLEPETDMKLIPMNDAVIFPSFTALALDGMGNPLCAGHNLAEMYYYDGVDWLTLPGYNYPLSSYIIDSMDFNPNENRFYAVGQGGIWYTDSLPFNSNSYCYRFNHFDSNGHNINAIAWNEIYGYGLVAEGKRLLKIWPYSYHWNGTLRYEVIHDENDYLFEDISWDTDGWNEAGIVGGYFGTMAYWRYYHSNPKLIEGHTGANGYYYACAMKPPSSPKWLFIPSSGGSIRVNIEAKDQSGEIIVSVDQPVIFDMGMWKQSDPMKLSILNGMAEANTTYTFFLEGNYTRNGFDAWDAMNLQFNLTAWYDYGEIGTNSVPGDPAWASNAHRTHQFKIIYLPGLLPALEFPVGTPDEFSIHSFWVSTGHGSDGSHRQVYINVTFGSQTLFSPGSLSTPPTMNYHPNTALNDLGTWDLNMTLYDINVPSARNSSYGEFGIKKYASIRSWGNPSGSVPPGSVAYLASPTYISYSMNAPYTLNISIPHLYKDANPALNFIPSGNVAVLNSHPNNDSGFTDLWAWTPFTVPNDEFCIWGHVSGAYTVPAPGNGKQSAGEGYTDFTVPLFEVTSVQWRVTVEAGTPEGTYRATITITLWS